MGYHGDDLDLRTPQASPGDLGTSPAASPFPALPRSRASVGPANGAPIWVDDTVLDICNHAYDVASAHRAIEVQLEHLIYALTRTDDATEALELRGVRVAALRREAAAAIATEIPAAHSNGKTSPRRAEAFEELLRLAAAHAYRRQAPVGVTDIVFALFDGGADFASLLRLLPSAFRPAAAHVDSLLDVEAVRDRIRNGPAPQSTRGLAADRASLSAAQVSTQHSRIDVIEQSIRTLTTELANERKILSGVLQDLQRELMAQREDTSRLGGPTQDKIQTIFGDRLQSLEQAFLSARSPTGGDIEGLQDRLSLLERALQTEISVTRAAVEALAERPELDLSPLAQRLETIDSTAAAERERAKAGEEALAARIQSFAEILERQPADISALVSNPLVEHLNAITVTRDSQHAAATDGIAEANHRLTQLEEAFSAHVARAETAETTAAEERSAIRDLLERLVETIAQESDSSRDAFTRLTENLTQDLSELHDGLSKVGANQHTLSTTLDAQGQDASVVVTNLLARIESLEKASAKPVEMLSALQTTVEKMHTVTVEKYYRRNRFWYWLFGTDDWLAASWPSQSKRIAEELRSLKS